MPRDKKHLVLEVLGHAVAVGGLLFGLRLCLQYMDPYREQREQAKKRSLFLRQKFGRALELNEYEQLLAAQVLNPDNIGVDLADVSGLDDIIRDLELKVLCPMAKPEVYRTTLFRPSRGVLLYGPPGTGKTMLAKAMAAGSGCYFLNLTVSAIMSKWMGDANKLVRAVFTLAEKLQPCIIFIDEVDAILGKRGGFSEHEASLQVKTEFMQLWDGMESSAAQRVVVMGATNRPQMVDEAVLRRFSIQYEVGLPKDAQRRAILTHYLTRHHEEVRGAGAQQAGQWSDEPRGGKSAAGHAQMGGKGVDASLLENLPLSPASRTAAGSSTSGRRSSGGGGGALDWLVKETAGYSGSDLMELCSQAAQRVLGEHWAAHARTFSSRPSKSLSDSSDMDDASAATAGNSELESLSLRLVGPDDFKAVLRFVKPASLKADAYAKRQSSLAKVTESGDFDMMDMMRMLMNSTALGAAGGAAGAPTHKANGHAENGAEALDEAD